MLYVIFPPSYTLCTRSDIPALCTLVYSQSKICIFSELRIFICTTNQKYLIHQSEYHARHIMLQNNYIEYVLYHIQGDFFSGTPHFRYQKENLASSQSRPFSVIGFTGTATLIGLR